MAGRRLFASRGNLILTADVGQPLRPFARFPLGLHDRLSAACRPLARLRRWAVHHIVLYRNRLVVMAFGRIWCFDAENGDLLGVPVPVIGSRPLALCAAPSGLYYGEYRNNPERGTIRLFRSEDGLRWEVVRRFERIRHIHGVYFDPHANALWVTTGDTDSESALWRSTDGFASLECVLSGSQRSRVVAMLFTEQHVFFGSDAPDEANHLYRYDRRRGTVTQLIDVEGSVFHAGQVDDWLLFSTAVEPSRVNRSRDAVLYGSPDGERWVTLARHRKDRWHLKYFQYGQLILPTGSNATGRCWYSTFAVDGEPTIFSGKLDDGRG